MKKILSIFLTVALIATLLVGCGNGSGGSNGDIQKITFLTNKTDIVDTTLRDYVDEFEKQNPNIKVTLEAVNDYYRVAQTRAAAGEMPDVSYLINALPKTDWPEYYMPLDDIGISGDLYFEDYYTYEGNLYAIPQQMNYSGIVYNKKVFADAGITEVPTTLDELYEASEKIKAIGVVPTSLILKEAGSAGPYIELIAPLLGDGNFQQDIIGKENPFTKNSPVGQGLQIARTLYDRGFLEEDLMSQTSAGMKKDLATGKMGWFFSQSWLVPQVVAAGAKSEDIGFIPMPVDNSGEAKTVIKPDMRLVISKDTKYPEAAKKFVQYIMDADYENFLKTIDGSISVRPSMQINLCEQFGEFETYEPAKVETTGDPDELKAVFNEAQIKWDDMVHDVIFMDSFDKCLDKYNKLWNDAIK